MKRSKNLSDYDKEIMNRIKSAKLLLVDLDGTLIDFKTIDHKIVKNIFGNNIMINTIDKLLWFVNNFDILGNGYAGLKIRLRVYSILSKKTYDYCKKEYGMQYEKLAAIELKATIKNCLIPIISKGHKVIIVTKNIYAKDLIINLSDTISESIKDDLSLIVLKKDKKEKLRDLVNRYNNSTCIIGNNLSDDIINSYKVGSPYIYIGKSKSLKAILRAINFMAYKLRKKSIYKRGISLKSFDEVLALFNKKEEK